ncbi:hypothetical protein HDU98_006529 [Podochytrium sp. JEL0797]|nr:hypothetical protein HDU98_006529 [Podochytrium sp. JEL0797]
MDLSFLAVIFLPFLLSHLHKTFFAPKTNTLKRTTPYTLFDALSVSLLLLSALANLLLAYSAKRDTSNVLTKWNIHVSTPPSLSRANYALHKHTPQDDALFDRLRSQTSRAVYLRAGHVAFTQCDWCQIDTPFDYFVFSLPSILIEYVAMGVLVGIASIADKRYKWRLWGTAVLTVGGALELLCLVSPSSFGIDPVSPLLTSIIRRSVFTLLCLSIAWFEQSIPITDSDRLTFLIEKQKQTLFRIQSSRLTTTAILTSPPLRTHYLAFQDAKQSTTRAVTESEEFKSQRETVMRSINPENVVLNARGLANNIIRTGIADGVLGAVHEPPPLHAKDL